MSETDKDLLRRILMTMERLKTENKGLEAQKEAYLADIARYKSRNAELKEKMKSISNVGTENGDLINKLSEEIRIKQQNLANIEKELSEHKERCEKIVYELCEERKNNKELEMKKNEVLDDLQRVVEHVKQLQNQETASERLKKALEKLRLMKQEHKSEKKKLLLRLSNTVAEIKSVEGETIAQNDRLDRLKKQISDLEAQIDHKNDLIDELDSSIDSIAQKIEEAGNQLTALDSSTSKMVKDIEQLNKEYQKEVKRASDTMKAYIARKERLKELKSGLDLVKKTISNRLKGMQGESEQQKKEIEAELTSKLEDSNQNVLKITERVGSLEQHNQELSEELDNLKSQHLRQKEEQQSQILALKKKFETLKSAIAMIAFPSP